jgi:RHS repeat-associated protein
MLAEKVPDTIDGGRVPAYDAFDRVVEVSNGSHEQVVYGPGGGKLAWMNGQTLQQAFVPLAGGAEAVYTPGGLAWYRHPDWLGSSRLASTPSRTVYYDGAYAPYGESYAESGTADHSFTGQNQNIASSGAYPLYDFMAREYNPTWGRWISPDPMGGDVTNAQSLNRYAYVDNNPASLTDPLGLDPGGDPGGMECADPQYAESNAQCQGPGSPWCLWSSSYGEPCYTGTPWWLAAGTGIYATGGGGGGGGSTSSAPPAGQPPLVGGSGPQGGGSGFSPTAVPIEELGACVLAPEVCAAVEVITVVSIGYEGYELWKHTRPVPAQPQAQPTTGARTKPEPPKRGEVCYELYLAETADCGARHTNDEDYNACMEVANLNYTRCKQGLPPVPSR